MITVYVDAPYHKFYDIRRMVEIMHAKMIKNCVRQNHSSGRRGTMCMPSLYFIIQNDQHNATVYLYYKIYLFVQEVLKASCSVFIYQQYFKRKKSSAALSVCLLYLERLRNFQLVLTAQFQQNQHSLYGPYYLKLSVYMFIRIVYIKNTSLYKNFTQL